MGLFGNRDAAEDASDWQSAFHRIADDRDALRRECARLRAELTAARRDIAKKLHTAFKRGTNARTRAAALWGEEEAALLFPEMESQS